MPPTARPLPNALGARFSVAQAAQADVPRRRLRAKDLASPFHGVRRRIDSNLLSTTDADDTPFAIDRRIRAEVLERARDYAVIMAEGAFFCGRTAAVIHGLPVAHGDELEVAVLSPRRAPRGRGIAGRRVAEHLAVVTPLDGLAITSPTTTWTMLGRDLSERELIIVGDAIVRVPRDDFGGAHPNLALATPRQLRAALQTVPGAPGRRRLESASGRVRVGSASPLETDYRLDAESAGLPIPLLDHEIRHQGRLLGISEIVYREQRTVVEVEGDHHRTSRMQWDRDLAKYRAYADAGWEVVRLSARNIRGAHADGPAIVRRTLLRRGWDGAPPV